MSQQVFKENLKLAQDQDFEIIIRKIRQITLRSALPNINKF